jgi:hypothetical protein
MSEQQQAVVVWHEITSTCTCQDYDETTDTFIDTITCFGQCWHEQMEVFTENTGDFFDDYRYVYRCEYNADQFDEYVARKADDFIAKMTNRISDFRIEYRMIESISDQLEYDKWFDTVDEIWCDAFGEPFDPNKKERALRLYIYHHDAPCGFGMTVYRRPYVG